MKPVYFFLGANSEEGFFSLYDQLLGGRLDDLMILKSTKNGVVGAEAVEAAAEDAFIQKLILAKKVQRAVGDGGTRQDQVIAADLTEPVQCLRALCLRVFDLAAFVAHDHVRVPAREFRLQPPATFVVDYDDLKTIADHVSDGIGFFRAGSIEHSQLIRKIREFFKLLLPDIHDRFRADHQHLSDLVLVVERTRQRNCGDRLACAHVHEKGTAFTCHRNHRLPSAPWQAPCEAVGAACLA